MGLQWKIYLFLFLHNLYNASEMEGGDIWQDTVFTDVLEISPFFYRISTRRPMSWDPIILICNNHVLDEGMDRVISYAFRTDTKARLADCTAKGWEISNKSVFLSLLVK